MMAPDRQDDRLATTQEYGYPRQVGRPEGVEGCPKRGGSGERLGDCRTCPKK